MKRMPIFVFLGAALEYFDYLLFPLLASLLMDVFFPNSNHKELLNFLFFALGSLIKLIGGVAFGIIADRFGRKSVILSLSASMALSTLLMGLLPLGLGESTYIAIFFILRTVQSLSFGAEMPSASTYAYEVNDRSNTQNISYIFIGASLGAVIATTILSVLDTQLHKTIEWIWRVPFIVGGMMGGLSFLYRKNLNDTYVANSKLQAVDVLKTFFQHKIKVMQACLILLFPVSLISLNIYFPFFFSTYLGISIGDVYSAQTISLIASMGFMIVAGLWVDKLKVSMNKIFIGCILCFIGVISFAESVIRSSILTFLIAWQLFIALTIVYGMKRMLMILPDFGRGMLSGFIYNITFLTVAFIPMIFSSIEFCTRHPFSLFYFTIGIGICSLLGMMRSSKN